VTAPQVTPRVPGKGYYRLDFGAVPLGEKVTRAVTVINTGEDLMPLRADILDIFGGFRLLSATRTIEPGSVPALQFESFLFARQFYEIPRSWLQMGINCRAWITMRRMESKTSMSEAAMVNPLGLKCYNVTAATS
jgi:hypothetical protein